MGANPLVRQSLAMGDRLMVTVDDAAAAVRPLTEALTQAGLTGVTLERTTPDLEDLFVQIVRRDEK